MFAPTARVRPVADRQALSTVAYGFIASKALVAALEIELFTLLAQGPRLVDELAVRTGVAETRMRTLLRALAAVGLVAPRTARAPTAPASRAVPRARGPRFAALWFLQYLAYNPRGVSFSAADLCRRLAVHGFGDPSVEVLIPEITKVIVCRKAGT
jgi:Dimerisation domain